MNHLWQSTLFAIAVGLLALALRHTRATVRYWLWFAASLKFLIPFAVLVTLGSDIPWRKPTLPAPIPTAAAPLRVIGDVGRPFPPLPAPNPHQPLTSAAVLSVVWAFGVAAVLFSWARRWLNVKAILQASSPLPLNLPIPVASSPANFEPGVFGIVRPVLLVPNGILDCLTPAQWNAIVAHEMCHVRRRDNLTAAIHMAVEAIFWFHPLVWWIGKQMIKERERACDEAVLLGVHDPQDYAEAILSVCKIYAGLPLACVSGITGSNLKKRIRAIMTGPVAADLPVMRKFALALAGIASLAIPLGIGVLTAPSIHAQSPPVPQLPPVAPPTAPPPAPRILAQSPPTPAAPPAEPAPPVGATVIGPYDELSINVFRNPDFTAVYPVHSDGTVVIPLVGAIKAEGLTAAQFRRKITEALSPFLRDPEVAVSFQTLAQSPPTPAAPPAEPAPPVGATVIGPYDELSINVFRNPDFTAVYPVHSDGTVVIPLVGAIKAEGLTAAQFQRKITEALSPFLRDPEVAVSFQTVAKTYVIVGTVRNPGLYPLGNRATVFDAIAAADGFLSSSSGVTDIVIVRGSQRLNFNYRAYITGAAPGTNVPLQNGDTVIVK